MRRAAAGVWTAVTPSPRRPVHEYWGWRRLVFPRRTIRPTRDGWWVLFAAVGLGVAAINTGNNLLYLLCSMLLGLVVVSGTLSEQTMRGLRMEGLLPEDMFAGRPAVIGASVENAKRRLASYSVAIEVLGVPPSPPLSFHVPRLEPGGRRLVTWECAIATRGRHRLPGVRVVTRFPFGLFTKVSRVLLDDEVVVFPAVRALPPDRLRRMGVVPGSAARRRGRGHELHSLREYRHGDDHRLIHWRSSARAQILMVRELEDETSLDTRLRLVGAGRSSAAGLETALSEAASLAVQLLRAGGAVELAGNGIAVPLGRGRDQERRILTALALFSPDPDARATVAAPPGAARALSEVVVDLG